MTQWLCYKLKNQLNEINEHLNQTNDIIENNCNRLEQSVEKFEKLGDNVISMTNINNDEIVEDVVLNSEDNNINYNYSIVSVSYTHLDVYKRQERELGEGIFVQGVQGLEFSFDVVLGGEEKSSCIFYKDKSRCV